MSKWPPFDQWDGDMPELCRTTWEDRVLERTDPIHSGDVAIVRYQAWGETLQDLKAMSCHGGTSAGMDVEAAHREYVEIEHMKKLASRYGYRLMKVSG
jgi:hypothetical protein